MKLVYQGKTKDVYDNLDGTYTLKLKDDATGKDGMFDPGENAVGLSIEGLGRESLRLTKYYFEKLMALNIPTQYIDCDIENTTMRVKPARMFGSGLEFVCRRRATGSFLRRYGAYAKQGMDLGCLVEVTLKDDGRQDPPITKDSLVALGIMSADEYESCKALTQKITRIIADDLALKGLELYDIKYEFGHSGDGVMLIDEISGGCMRVYKGSEVLHPMELTKCILGDGQL